MAQPNAAILESYLKTFMIDAEHSRIRIGNHEVAFHCDKFNTRIIKGLEDVIGVADSYKLLVASAEKATLQMFSDFLVSEIKPQFDALSPEDKFTTLVEIGKLLGYGALNASRISDKGGEFSSPSSYLAEGWLENQTRWNWKQRTDPVCYDMCGFIAGVLSIVYGKPAGTYKVTEMECRSKGDSVCNFKAEVK
ncbi:hypothetical protein GX441_11045 [bacterium]|nr:hypothetical protein [bacterium]